MEDVDGVGREVFHGLHLHLLGIADLDVDEAHGSEEGFNLVFSILFGGAEEVFLLDKVEGRWLIAGLTVLEENPEAAPAPTPDYSQLEG